MVKLSVSNEKKSPYSSAFSLQHYPPYPLNRRHAFLYKKSVRLLYLVLTFANVFQTSLAARLQTSKHNRDVFCLLLFLLWSVVTVGGFWLMYSDMKEYEKFEEEHPIVRSKEEEEILRLLDLRLRAAGMA